MKVKITASMVRNLIRDLQRPIGVPGIHERLAVVHTRYASESTQTVVVVIGYELMPDTAYRAGPDAANFDVRWLIKAGERGDQMNYGILLTHLHNHKGRPWFSPADLSTANTILYQLYRFSPQFPQGALLFSLDTAVALIATTDGYVAVRDVSVIR